jgi:hypothetical protein
MKKGRTIFLVGLFAAWGAVAQQQTNVTSTTSASHTNTPSAAATSPTVKPEFHLWGPAEAVSKTNGPRMIEGLDTRSWTMVAEDDSGNRVFPDAGTHQPGLTLLWWGSEPRPK